VIRRALAVALVLAAAACSNAGEDRILAVTATGVARGIARIDNNGNGTLDLFADTAFAGLRVRLVLAGAGDTVATAVTTTTGEFRIDSLPVGRYQVSVDTAVLGDTLRLVKVDSTSIVIRPGDSVFVSVLVAFPTVTIADARALAVGRKVFVTGVVLVSSNTFRDTTAFIQDTTRAIRVERMLGPLFAGDRTRLFGTTARRAGQAVLRDVTPFSLGAAFLPTAVTLSTGAAASADSGRRDAEIVIIERAEITDTATVALTGEFRLTVRDSIGVDTAGVDSTTGPLEVILDPTADPVFGQSFSPFFPYLPGKYVRLVGVLVPTGAVGVWQLKPRSSADIVELP
jgi:hypothetical protein